MYFLGRRTSRGAKVAQTGEAHAVRRAGLLVLLGIAVLTSACASSAAGAGAPHAAPAGASATPTGGSSGLAAGQLHNAPHAQQITPHLVADRMISQMSLDEELGQLFLVDFLGQTYSADDATMIQQQHVAGVILYGRNIGSADQTRTLLQAMQADATIPLLTSVDEEGGTVDRLQNIYGPRPSATYIGSQGAGYARAQGTQVAQDMHAVGLNFNLAPVVDVQLADGPDQYLRTFGTTPETVTSIGGAYLAGLQQDGVVGCLKHFPGLGAAQVDAHTSLPVINRSRDQIESVELAPYRTLIQSGQVHAIMTTDLLMPALDPTMPAELSQPIITGVLRDELGYDGVVVTDALAMQGIANQWDMAQAGVLAIKAGDDLLEGMFTPDQVQWMIQSLKDALANGTLTKARIDQSVRRILIMKLQMGLIPLPAR